MPKPNGRRLTTKNRSFVCSDQRIFWATDSSKPLWEYLSDEILDPTGKQIVSADPELSDQTMEKLEKHVSSKRKIDVEKYDLKLGSRDQPDLPDIGMALLSSCINDNPKATRAELVTRMAAICGFPFYEVAKGIITQEHTEEGLFRYDHNTHYPIKWSPRRAGKAIPKASFEVKTDISSEWRMLGESFG